jgi:uncharacterized alkaline shock family protein YloU
MEGTARISADVLASYAADAALEVEGVRGLTADRLPPRPAARVTNEDDAVSVELHLEVEWGASIPAVGRAVQQRVADYLRRMADVRPASVDVVVDGIGPE